MNSAIIEIDVHNKSCAQAMAMISAILYKSKGVYRIRVIHGCHGGTAIRDMIRTEFPKRKGVIRVESVGEGRSEIVLREY